MLLISLSKNSTVNGQSTRCVSRSCTDEKWQPFCRILTRETAVWVAVGYVKIINQVVCDDNTWTQGEYRIISILFSLCLSLCVNNTTLQKVFSGRKLMVILVCTESCSFVDNCPSLLRTGVDIISVITCRVLRPRCVTSQSVEFYGLQKHLAHTDNREITSSCKIWRHVVQKLAERQSEGGEVDEGRGVLLLNTVAVMERKDEKGIKEGNVRWMGMWNWRD